MALIFGTTGDDSILRGLNSAGVVVVTPPFGPNAGEDDLVLALAGNDIVAPGDGDDTAFLGAGDDRFIWDPGEGSDVVRGGLDVDTLEFNGSDAVETFTISDANGGVQLFRDVGNILMDLTSIERIELNGLDGDDVVDASALTQPVELVVNGGRGNDTATLGAGDDRFIWNPGDGSDVVDGGDGTDTLEFNGSGADEEFTIFEADGGVQLFRDVGNILMDLADVERIELNGLGGNDLVDAASLTQDVELIIDAGEGDDVVIAGSSSDNVRGGGGSDFMLGGTASDRFVFGIEASDGTIDLDTIGDYEIGSDVLDLAEAGGLAGSEQVTGGLLLTLAGADGDQVFLANVDAIDDVMIA
jgi:Ca2+-binding RTX toxin-like protein